MTNSEIREKILSLRQEKRNIIQQMKTFELNKDLMQIAQKIKELQQICTHVDENGNKIPINIDDAIVIDELVYLRIVDYLRCMFDIHPKVEVNVKGKTTKQWIIDEERMNLEIEKKRREKETRKKSFLYPLISAMVNHPGFKYKKNELKEVGIVEFMDSVKRLQTYESVRALMSGMYSGMIDTSKLNLKEELNWMRDLYK